MCAIALVLNRRQSDAALRYAERRRREDEAVRLQTLFPRLQTLRFEVRERRSGAPVSEAGYIRRIVVENAPALFVLPCGDPSCKEGGHDVTHTVLSALRSSSVRFEGEDSCAGQTGSAQCSRELQFVAFATYSP